MAEPARRFENNPILSPAEVPPSRPDFVVECVLNPGAFRYEGKTYLVLRVAERPPHVEGRALVPVIREGKAEVLQFSTTDPEVDTSDPRLLRCSGVPYLTTLSHLRLAWSTDGLRFTVAKDPLLTGAGPLESYGIEDCRVSFLEGRYYLTYTAVSANGHGVACVATRDWKSFERMGMVLPPPNKDAAIFTDKTGGGYHMLHRPSSIGIGGSYIWLAQSPDLRHWGNHVCVATTRRGMWDSTRIGVGGEPLRTREGWLVIYHGADERNRYCMGAMLLDLREPSRVLARSEEPLIEPRAAYETNGFFGNVVFSCGHILDGDTLVLYYGAADTVICGARVAVGDLLRSLSAVG